MKNDHGGNIIEFSINYRGDPANIIDFSANINPLGCPSPVREILITALDSILNYPEVNSSELTTGLSEYHGITQDHILVGNGSTEFIYLIPIVFKPKRALIVIPAFSEYEKALQMVGCEVSYFQTAPEIGFSIDVRALCSRAREGFDIVYMCNPANPTGILTSKEDIRSIITCAEEMGAVSVIDEAFIDFVETGSVKSETTGFSHLIVLRSMTKFFGMPGLRIGYVMSSRQCIDRMREYQPPWTVNALAQCAGAKALSDRDYIRETRKYVIEERSFLRESLRKITGFTVYEGAANFLLVSMDSRIGLHSTNMSHRLAEEGILIRDCSNFQGLGDHYLRIAVRTHEENVILIEKIREILKR